MQGEDTHMDLATRSSRHYVRACGTDGRDERESRQSADLVNAYGRNHINQRLAEPHIRNKPELKTNR